MTFQPGQPVMIKPGTTHNPEWQRPGTETFERVARPATVEREMAGGEFVIVKVHNDFARRDFWVRTRAEDLEVAS